MPKCIHTYKYMYVDIHYMYVYSIPIVLRKKLDQPHNYSSTTEKMEDEICSEILFISVHWTFNCF